MREILSRSRIKPVPELERLHELFRLSEDGRLIWRKTVFRGREAGTLTNGYMRVRIDREAHYLHRIVFYMAFGVCPDGHEIDHINHNKSDNSPSNLRLATRKQNCSHRNERRPDGGYRNVAWNKRGFYEVGIQRDGKKRYFGVFRSLEEAVAASRKGRQELFGEFSGTHQ